MNTRIDTCKNIITPPSPLEAGSNELKQQKTLKMMMLTVLGALILLIKLETEQKKKAAAACSLCGLNSSVIFWKT